MTTTLTGNERLLVVEDQADLRTMLAEHGYQVHQATDGGQALAILERHASDFGLVITDVVMPVMGGAQLHHRLHERNPRLGFIFSTGYSVGEGPDDLPRGGRIAFLTTPYTIATLLGRVRELLDRPDEPPDLAPSAEGARDPLICTLAGPPRDTFRAALRPAVPDLAGVAGPGGTGPLASCGPTHNHGARRSPRVQREPPRRRRPLVGGVACRPTVGPRTNRANPPDRVCSTGVVTPRQNAAFQHRSRGSRARHERHVRTARVHGCQAVAAATLGAGA